MRLLNRLGKSTKPYRKGGEKPIDKKAIDAVRRLLGEYLHFLDFELDDSDDLPDGSHYAVFMRGPFKVTITEDPEESGE